MFHRKDNGNSFNAEQYTDLHNAHTQALVELTQVADGKQTAAIVPKGMSETLKNQFVELVYSLDATVITLHDV